MIGVIPTILYAIIIVILNIVRYIEGPYPFFRVYNQSIIVSIIWIVIIMGLVYFISYMLYKLHNRRI